MANLLHPPRQACTSQLETSFSFRHPRMVEVLGLIMPLHLMCRVVGSLLRPSQGQALMHLSAGPRMTLSLCALPQA